MGHGKQGVEGILQNLLDAGCDKEIIEKFIEMEKAGQYREQIRLLTPFRKSLLQRLHICQKQLDCLDYLLYSLRENTEKPMR